MNPPAVISGQGSPPPTGFNTFTDGNGNPWVSYNGSPWKLAYNALQGRLYRNGAATTPATWTLFGFDAIQRDPYNMYNGWGFTVPISGIYLAINQLTVSFAAGTFWVNGAIAQNGSLGSWNGMSSPAPGYTPVQCVDEFVCNAGDQLNTQWNANAGGQPLVTGSYYSYMAIKYQGTG